MGEYAVIQTFTREFRKDLDWSADEFFRRVCGQEAEKAGFHPVGAPRIDWHEITTGDVEMELAAQRLAGVKNPVTPFRAGDWRARAVVSVAENEPIAPKG